MPDIILPGSAGRIEARYQRQKNPGAPMALVLHPHPQFGGTMNNPLVYDLFHMFHGLGCTTVRFNFRGVGRSQGSFDNGSGELSDAAAVLDWMNTLYPNPSNVWVCGISFGAWVRMQRSLTRTNIPNNGIEGANNSFDKREADVGETVKDYVSNMMSKPREGR